MNISLDEIKVMKFEEFMNYMILWNDRVRLTSIIEEDEVIDKHFVDSLSVLKTNLFDGNKKVLDLGTGGGFPGIPLKFYNEKINLTMLDSRLKKIEYLENVIEKFNLKNTIAIHGRAEDYGKMEEYREKFDIVVSRAVAELATLAEFCLPFTAVNGYFIAMKGLEIENELNDAEKAINVLGGEIQDVIKFVLPETDINRSIIIIKKIEKTPEIYPRSSGKPKKKPIKG
jgi:16S rRNA (guanine527-N7)-methyltransferase